jgi:hypothetical protein
MNYSQLVTEIQNYTENQFTTDVVNTFITQAEQRIYNTVQLPALRKNVTGTTTSGNKYLAMPTNWLATFSLAVINANNEYTYLLNKDVNFIRQSYPDTDADFYGTPAYYAVFDNTAFIMGPTPDASYAMELHYFYYPESITTAGTTWLGDNFSSTLLYGSLLEAYTYMKGEADVIAK